ncbi:MAG: 30S ribosomal protein S20 [Chloroflexota bacterium]|nr:30S ribosomal protein S20 [Chloroflexota bacterium]
MAHSKSALKRWRQNEAHRERNKPARTEARTAARKAHATIVASPPDEAQAAIRAAAGILDRAAKRKIIHKNAASRHKSRMMLHLNKVVGVSAAAAEAPKKARKTAAKPTTKAKAAAKPRATVSRAAAAAKKKA